MIEIKPKIHDRYSIEFKMGFLTDHDSDDNDFTVGMWLFVPGSLDITPATFTKAEFYRSVKSNVRMITPQFELGRIVSGDALPLKNVLCASEEDYEYQLKMFAAIVKSALRNGRDTVLAAAPQDSASMYESFLAESRNILEKYASFREGKTHDFCGEFLCRCISKEIFSLIEAGFSKEKATVLIRYIDEYRASRGFRRPDPDSPDRNSSFIHRNSVLKKYVESQLYLRVPKKRDGVLAEQAYFSIAAGLAMLFATVVAWAFQRRFGNLTWPLFIALVISYMMKDRIKELMRYYFAHRVSDRYFDNKAVISHKSRPVGWLKEAVDFIPESKVPLDIKQFRDRIHLFDAENYERDEKVILYRKKVHLDRRKLEENPVYEFDGINDIIRIQVRPFLRKMDDPEVHVDMLDSSGEVRRVSCDKDYCINMIFQYRHRGDVQLKRYRITLNRDGIKKIDEIDSSI